MMDNGLLLGPIAFQGFELPQGVTWGGAQNLAVHQLPGGERVIDLMGRNHGDIVWEGIFTGPDAATRARGVDLMRASGGVWPLSWNFFFYTVVVSRFEAEYMAQNGIPYRITCSVVRDEAESVAGAALSLTASIANDLGTAMTYGSGVPLAAACSACSATGATQPGSAAYNAASVELANAGRAIGEATVFAENSLSEKTIRGPEDLLAATSTARGFAGRAAVNLANAAI